MALRLLPAARRRFAHYAVATPQPAGHHGVSYELAWSAGAYAVPLSRSFVGGWDGSRLRKLCSSVWAPRPPALLSPRARARKTLIVAEPPAGGQRYRFLRPSASSPWIRRPCQGRRQPCVKATRHGITPWRWQPRLGMRAPGRVARTTRPGARQRGAPPRAGCFQDTDRAGLGIHLACRIGQFWITARLRSAGPPKQLLAAPALLRLAPEQTLLFWPAGSPTISRTTSMQSPATRQACGSTRWSTTRAGNSGCASPYRPCSMNTRPMPLSAAAIPGPSCSTS